MSGLSRVHALRCTVHTACRVVYMYICQLDSKHGMQRSDHLLPSPSSSFFSQPACLLDSDFRLAIQKSVQARGGMDPVINRAGKPGRPPACARRCGGKVRRWSSSSSMEYPQCAVTCAPASENHVFCVRRRFDLLCIDGDQRVFFFFYLKQDSGSRRKTCSENLPRIESWGFP